MNSINNRSRFGRQKTGVSFADRFWMRIDRSGGDDACWPWLSSKTASGYGQFSVKIGGKYKNSGAHRIAWELVHGEALPPTDSSGVDVICHKCDNPPCCNPRHLFRGTAADNMSDMDRKGRRVNPVGEASGGAKLTSAQVRSMRELHAGGTLQKDLATMFGVRDGTVCKIIKRQLWKHLE